MSPHDIIELLGQPGQYARRVIVDAWLAAGAPPVNSAGRLVAEQQAAYDAWQNGTGSPADDPRRPDRDPLAHVRFVALDITPTEDRVQRLATAGLIRPYSWEPWHWEVPNVRAYDLVTEIPREEDDMYTDADRARDNQTARDVAWIKTRIGGSVKDMSLADAVQWIRTRVGGSVRDMSVTSLAEWIKTRIGGSVNNATLTEDIRQDRPESM